MCFVKGKQKYPQNKEVWLYCTQLGGSPRPLRILLGMHPVYSSKNLPQSAMESVIKTKISILIPATIDDWCAVYN